MHVNRRCASFLVGFSILILQSAYSERHIEQLVVKSGPDEIHFVRCEYPIVLEPKAGNAQGCFIAIPIERLTESGCTVTFSLLVEEWDESKMAEFEGSPQRDRHVSLYMQRDKTKGQSGFCASARKLPVGKVSEQKLHYSSKPPTGFYASVFVAPWVKRVTILKLEVSDSCRFIEKPAPATPEQELSIKNSILQLADDDYLIRHKAHQSLIQTGWPAKPLLTSYLNDDDPERRIQVRQIIQAIDKAQVPLVTDQGW